MQIVVVQVVHPIIPHQIVGKYGSDRIEIALGLCKLLTPRPNGSRPGISTGSDVLDGCCCLGRTPSDRTSDSQSGVCFVSYLDALTGLVLVVVVVVVRIAGGLMDGIRRRARRVAELRRILAEIRMQQEPVARPPTRRILVDALLQEINDVRILQALGRHFGLQRLERDGHRQRDALVLDGRA